MGIHGHYTQVHVPPPHIRPVENGWRIGSVAKIAVCTSEDPAPHSDLTASNSSSSACDTASQAFLEARTHVVHGSTCKQNTESDKAHVYRLGVHISFDG